VLIVRIEDGAEVLAHKPGGAPITALAGARPRCRLRTEDARPASSISREGDRPIIYLFCVQSAVKAGSCIVRQPMQICRDHGSGMPKRHVLEFLAIIAELHHRRIMRPVARVEDLSILIVESSPACL